LPDTQPLSATEPNTQQPPAEPSLDHTNNDDAAAAAVPDDHDIEAEIGMNDDTMNLDTTSSDNPTTSQPPPAHLTNGDTTTNNTTLPPTTEPRIPQKKDASLREFLGKMDDYAPIIPDAVTDYYLSLAGLPPPPQTDRRLARLMALATQKFIADIAADAYQYSRIRSTNTTSNNPLTGLGGAAGFGATMGAGEGGEGGGGAKGKKGDGKAAPLGGPRAGFGGGGAGAGQGRTVLTMEDLGMGVGDDGVNVRRGEFYR